MADPMAAVPMPAETACTYPPLEVLPGNLPKPFRVLERVMEYTQDRLSARMMLMSAGNGNFAVWELLEAMGQAACLHQRLLSGWKRQAMVLAFPRMEFGELAEFGAGEADAVGLDVAGPEAEGGARGEACACSGPRVHAELVAQATSAAAYSVWVEDVADGDTRLVCRGEVKVGLMDWPGEDAGHSEACRERSVEMWRCVLE